MFNGVRVLLTTGEREHEVQNLYDQADVVISVYPPPIGIRWLREGTVKRVNW